MDPQNEVYKEAHSRKQKKAQVEATIPEATRCTPTAVPSAFQHVGSTRATTTVPYTA